MGPFPYPRTWPRLVHVTILLALALALGVGYPDAEAKKPGHGRSAHERGRQPAVAPTPEGNQANPDTKGGDSKGKPPRTPNSPGKTPNSPGKGELGSEPTTPQPNTPSEPSTPSRPNAPSEPSTPATPATNTPPPPPTAPSPAVTPAPRVIDGSGEERSGSRRRDNPRQARRVVESGGTLPLVALGTTGAAVELGSPSLVRPVAGLEGSGEPRGSRDRPARKDEGGSSVTRTVRDIVEVVPDSIKLALAGLAALSILLGGASLFTQLRARRLDAQRRELLQEVGLLQGALLPPVPDTLGSALTSVAYRPADGPGAGGDFYDAIPLAGGRAAFILGDISGHGRDALERTAFLRYTLRAYIEAGLEPRVVLQVAGRVIDEQLGGDFATVLVAIYDPHSGSLTYASAGHPAPIVSGPSTYEPVLAASSPPIGVGVPTGLRQTTLPLAPGSVACLYTDGLTEARTERGLVGRGRLGDLVEELGRNGTAEELLERVAAEARLVSDDMAACLITPATGVTVGGFRTEQLELSSEDLADGLAEHFLAACGVAGAQMELALGEARDLTKLYGGTVLRVVFGNRLTVEALPRNVQSIEAASRKTAVH